MFRSPIGGTWPPNCNGPPVAPPTAPPPPTAAQPTTNRPTTAVEACEDVSVTRLHDNGATGHTDIHTGDYAGLTCSRLDQIGACLQGPRDRALQERIWTWCPFSCEIYTGSCCRDTVGPTTVTAGGAGLTCAQLSQYCMYNDASMRMAITQACPETCHMCGDSDIIFGCYSCISLLRSAPLRPAPPHTCRVLCPT